MNGYTNLFSFCVQMFFHYNVVQQLKSLHDVTLYPDYFQESTAVTPTSLTAKGERGEKGGKKGEDKSGGTKRGGAGGGGSTGKEKKAAKQKEEPGAYLLALSLRACIDRILVHGSLRFSP
jgi:hypothetical protein